MTRAPRSRQAGLSLVELMIAITIGLLITAGLVTVFANSSQTQNELRRTAQQIENGRYAMDVMIQDLQVAGFYGSYRKLSTPTAIPSNPCSTSTAATALQTDINTPIQAYSAASATAQASLPSGCSTLIPTEDLAAGSDILVIRRASTTALDVKNGEKAIAGAVYMQLNPASFELQTGANVASSCTKKADGSTNAIITRRCQFPTSTDTCSATCATTSPGGYIRQLHVHVYYVSPCNVYASGQSKCTAAADGGRPIPTLKRLELSATGGAAAFLPVAIAEGVEFMKVAFGVDDTPSTINADTGLKGDGSPDSYVAAPSLAQLPDVVTARLDLLVRNPEPSLGYSDSKTYRLGVDPAAPTTNPAVVIDGSSLATNYRRHVYNTEVRLVNMSSRKEIP